MVLTSKDRYYKRLTTLGYYDTFVYFLYPYRCKDTIYISQNKYILKVRGDNDGNAESVGTKKKYS